MKKWLRISLIITGLTILFSLISDLAFGTDYVTGTWIIFRPFPHLILFGSILCDLVFWYRLRKEKREASMTRTPSRKSPLDYIILWIAICLAAATSAFFLEWLAAILLP